MIRIDENNSIYVKGADIPKKAVFTFIRADGANIIIDMNPLNDIKKINYKEDMVSYVNRHISKLLSNSFDMLKINEHDYYKEMNNNLNVLCLNLANVDIDFYNKLHSNRMLEISLVLGTKYYLISEQYGREQDYKNKIYGFDNIYKLIEFFINFFILYTDPKGREIALATLIKDISILDKRCSYHMAIDDGNLPTTVLIWNNLLKEYVVASTYIGATGYERDYCSFTTIVPSVSNRSTTDMINALSRATNGDVYNREIEYLPAHSMCYSLSSSNCYELNRPITTSPVILNREGSTNLISVAGYQLENIKNVPTPIGMLLTFKSSEFASVIRNSSYNITSSHFVRTILNTKCDDSVYDVLEKSDNLSYCIDNLSVNLDVCYFTKSITFIQYSDLKDRKMPVERRDVVMRILCQLCYANNITPHKLLNKIDCKFIKQYKEKNYPSFVV